MFLLRKLLICAVILTVFAINANASPFLVSDPETSAIGGFFEVYSCVSSGLTDSDVLDTCPLIASENNESDGSIRYDLYFVTEGVYYWYLRYGLSVSYDTLYSVFTPFPFKVNLKCTKGSKKKRVCSLVFTY